MADKQLVKLCDTARGLGYNNAKSDVLAILNEHIRKERTTDLQIDLLEWILQDNPKGNKVIH